MREPVRILSDLHLGHSVSRLRDVERLRPLIRGAGTVIFNGDTWQELSTAFRPQAEILLDGLRRMCEEEDVEAIFLSGNHDPGWPGKGWISLAAGKIIITHGDALLYGGSPWKREILRNAKRVEELWADFPTAETDAETRIHLARRIAQELRSVRHPQGRHLHQRAWDAMVPPSRAWKMLAAWLTQADAGAAFCERYFPQAECLIIGHFHYGGLWLKRGIRVINTGSFMNPGRAGWIEWRGEWLRYGLVEESPEGCRFGPCLREWQFSVS